MTNIAIVARHISAILIRRLLATVMLSSVLMATAVAQGSVIDSSTPPGLAPGAPTGSYALSDLENINLFNGHLNFRLPLLKMGGRGSVGYTVLLALERKWIVRHQPWEFGVFEFPTDVWWQSAPSYSPGRMDIRQGGNAITCTYPGPPFGVTDTHYASTLTRLTFTAPDGTEFELRDQLTGGRPLTPTWSVCMGGTPVYPQRGNVFVTADGTAATFISDTPIHDAVNENSGVIAGVSGYLILRDGTRYRIDSNRVSWVRDRNGNKVSFTYQQPFGPLTAITDSLNRQVTIAYNDQYDEITYKGFGGATRTIRVHHTALSQALRADYTPQQALSLDQLFPELNPLDTSLYDTRVISSVELPDGRRYRFYYNHYGELARAELPTGGAIEYDHTPGSGVVGTEIIRSVIARRVYTNGGTGSAFDGQTTYHYNINLQANMTTVVVNQLNPSGALLSRERHYFYGTIWDSFGLLPISYPRWKEGKEYQTEWLDTNDPSSPEGGTVLRRVLRIWQQRAPVSWWPWPGAPCPSQDCAPPNDPRIVEVVTTIADTNQVSKQTFAHDQYNNVTDIWKYDFGIGAPGPLIRRTHTPYLTANGNQGNVNYATDNNIHIRNLPIQKLVYDAAGNPRAHTDFFYDNYGGFPLVDRPGIVQHDSGFHAGYGARGNLTGVILRNPGGSPSEIHLHNQYDIAGNLMKAVDGRGIATDIDFSDSFGSPGDDPRSNAGAPELAGGFSYAFPTKVTNALGHTGYIQYDYYLGSLVTSEDANGVVSSIAYDVLDRPTQAIQARYKVGGGVPAERRQTTFTYDDANRVNTTTSDLNTFNDNVLTAKSYYDGLGRTWRGAAYEGSTWTITDTRFDALGRVSQVSNPYRATDPDSASPPSGAFAEWTTTDYDALGRVIRVTTPDGAHVDTTYSGNQVTGADQAVKKRRSQTDALGRLIRITEDPGGLNYETSYSYDVLDNLRQVTQGAQTRSFVYDSLSRLTSATNPESGTMTYAYDPNGNLTQKTDARGVRTTMAYDALNRARSKAYSGTTSEGTMVASLTPPVNYFYDDYSGLPSGAPSFPGTPSKGRLVGVTHGPGSEGTYYKYDAAGRIVTKHQRMGTSNYVATYFYNLADAVTREDRGSPARRRNWMYYDEAGRLLAMQSGIFNAFGFEPRDLVNFISYTPFGGLQSETYGNGLIHSMAYNSRLQPTEIRLGRPDDLESVFRLGYIFGTADNVNVQDGEITRAHNNGNVARIKYFISGTVQYTQTFQYDPLNRLRYAVEHNNGVHNDDARAWYQTFDYDRYGNRGINVANTSDNVDGANTALQLAGFSAANNRITRAGFAYDSAGNLIAEPGKSYTYDAENRLVEATVAGGAAGQYFYDGNGRRVKKIVGGVGTRFEYGAGGELIAEWNDADSGRVVQKDYFYKGGELLATSEVGNSAQYEYATADHLGSPRAWTDDDGALIAGGRHDYLPYGEELFAGVGIRSASLGYGADSARQKFTGYERDGETGLDFAQARYFASLQGRFTSPDSVSGKLSNPQTLNLYAYVQNNPLAFVDPTGHVPIENGNDPLTSTHTDSSGNIVAVYDDGDLGVYRHDDLSKWDGKSILPRSGPGVTRMGETEIWHEFREHNNNTGAIKAEVAEDARISFGSSFDPDIESLNKHATGRSLDDVAADSKNKRAYDIKVDQNIAPFGPNTGRLLNGKYATARTAGNYLAGLNGATAKLAGAYISEATMMKLAGALQQKQFTKWHAFQIVTFGKSFGPAPWYGEIEYSGRPIQAGFRRGVSLRPKTVQPAQPIRCPKC